MKKIIVLLIAFLSVYQTYSQRNIYIGEKKYIATDEWDFSLGSSEELHDFKNIQLSVLKKGISGYLMLSYPEFQGAAGSRIFMILENDETITLTQKIITDDVDRKTQVLFSISQIQYKKLKESDIIKIRFSTGGRNHTANNHYLVEKYDNINFKVYWDDHFNYTSEEIRKLDEYKN